MIPFVLIGIYAGFLLFGRASRNDMVPQFRYLALPLLGVLFINLIEQFTQLPLVRGLAINSMFWTLVVYAVITGYFAYGRLRSIERREIRFWRVRSREFREGMIWLLLFLLNLSSLIFSWYQR
jgi:hypothetical protein